MDANDFLTSLQVPTWRGRCVYRSKVQVELFWCFTSFLSTKVNWALLRNQNNWVMRGSLVCEKFFPRAGKKCFEQNTGLTPSFFCGKL